MRALAPILALLLTAPLGAQQIQHHPYTSRIFGEARELLVRTPPGYDPARAYPVLILLHGVMERPGTWFDEVQADRVLDELLAQGAAEPMLLVCPSSYGFPDAEQRAIQAFGAPPARQEAWMEQLGRDLVEEVLPLLEARYRLRPGRAGLALAGFSMGGAEALYIGLRHRDRFGSLGAFSGAFILFGERLEAALPCDGPAPGLLWLGCGREDPLLAPCRAAAARLATPLHEAPGGHTPESCRAELRAFLPLLFHP